MRPEALSRSIPRTPKAVVALVLTAAAAVGLLATGGKTAGSEATAATTSTSGTLAGDFEVNQDGAATYEIPLPTPPGTGGMQPSLSLAYSSDGDDGLLGLGWALEGLSAIERCGATLAQDGFTGGVEYNAGDRFCLDGMRLIRVDGSEPGEPYYEPGAVYHTEKETWRRIVGEGDCAGGPCTFAVELKTGQVLSYGTGSSQILAVGAPFDEGQPLHGAVRVWALGQARDLDGNTLEVAYTQTPEDSGGAVVPGTSGGGQYYPQRIDYTANAAGDLPAQRSVQLFYEARDDAPTRYQGGATIRTAARLATVRTCLDPEGIAGATCQGGNVVTEIRLDYPAYSPTTGRSLLGAITQCGGDGLCYPPTTFTYQPGDNALVSVNGEGTSNKLSTSAAFCSPGDGLVEWADFNGDGLADWICNDPSGATQGSVWVLASTGSELTSASSRADGELANHNALCARANGEVTWADFNGDGKVDWICNNPTGAGGGSNVGSTWVLLSSGDDLGGIGGSTSGLLANESAYCGNQGADSQVVVEWADFNGDSRLDWICNDPDQSGDVWVLLSTGSDLAKTPAGNTANGRLPLKTGLAACAGGAENTRWADFNGDRLVDWICNQPSAQASQSGYVWVLASDGDTLEPVGPYQDGQLTGSFSALCDESVGSAEWFDFNGDGLTDWICNDYLASGNVWVLLSTGTTLESINGPGDGRGSLGLSTATCPQGSVVSWVDFNGDDLIDWTCADTTGTGDLTVLLSTGSSLVPADGGGSLGTGLALCDEDEAFPAWTDFNGDGLADWVCNQRQASSTGRSGFVWVSLNEPPVPDFLTSISDGLGAETSIVYEPLTDAEVYTLKPTPDYPQGEATAFPDLNLDQPLYVVSEYTLANDPAKNRSSYAYTYQLHYAGGLLNLQGLGFLGFAEVTRRDTQMSTHLTTFYHQDYPFDGEPEERALCQGTDASVPCDPSGPFLVKTDYAYACQGEAGGQACQVGSTYNPYPGVFQVLLAGKSEEGSSFGYRLEKTYDYDRYGNLTRLVNPGDVASGHASHPVTTCQSFLNDEERWLLGFPVNEKVGTASDCPEDWETYTFDDASDLTWQVTTYNEAMNVRASVAWDSANGIWLGTEVGYEGDAFGNPTSQTTLSGADPQPVPGTTARTTYDATFYTFPAEEETPPAKAGDPSSALTQYYAYDARFGVQVGQTDDNGKVSTVCLDSLGRIAATQGPQQGTGAPADANCLAGDATLPGLFTGAKVVTLAQSTYSSPAASDVFTEVESRTAWGGASWASAPKAWVRTYVDGLGRSRRTVAQGDGADVVTERAYLTQRLVEKVSLPYDEGTAAADIQWVRMGYDAYGRRKWVTRPYAGEPAAPASRPCTSADPATTVTTCWSYSAPNTTTITQAANAAEARSKVTRFEYFDDDRRTVAMTTGGPDGGTTQYHYDALGRPEKVVDPGGVVNELTFDSLSRRLTFAETNTGETVYAYDDLGNLHQTTDAEGRRVVYVYDGLNRPTAKTLYAAGGGTTGTVTYTYDTSADPELYHNVAGRLSTVTVAGDDGGSATVYGYDAYGNPERSTVTLAGVDYPFANVFDPLGRVVERTFPDPQATTLTAAYTPGGNLGQLLLADAAAPTPVPYVTWSGYNALGQPGTVTYGSEVGRQAGESYTYFDNGRLDTHTLAESDGTQAFAGAYSWDRFGNVAGILDCNFQGNAGKAACAGIGGQGEEDLSTVYGYELDRLTRASGAFGELSFGYDPGGNLESRTTAGVAVTYTYEGQQVTGGSDGFSAHYDAAGNMDAKTGADGTEWVYTWDVENRLRQVGKRVGGDLLEVAAFTYDDSGQRLSKVLFGEDGQSVSSSVLYPAPDFEVVPGDGGRDPQYSIYLTGPDGKVAAITRQGPVGAQAQTAGVAAVEAAAQGRKARHLYRRLLAALLLVAAAVAVGGAVGIALRTRGRPAPWARPLWVRAAAPVALAALVATCALLPAPPARAADEAPPGTPLPGTTYFFIQDQVGSTRFVTDGAGRVVSRVVYAPYGGVVDLEGSDAFRPKFNGNELDSATGLYYFNARYYDPAVGRFLSADDELGASPFTPDAFNRYAFGLNNPVRYSDPSGHSSDDGIPTLQKAFYWVAILGTAIGLLGTAIGLLGAAAHFIAKAAGYSGLAGFVREKFFGGGWGEYARGQREGEEAGYRRGMGDAFAQGEDREALAEYRGWQRGRYEGEQEGYQRGFQEGQEGCDLLSFQAGTSMATEAGDRPIETVKAGGKVWAFDPATGEKGLYTVGEIFTRVAPGYLVLTAGEVEITVTPEHPFWVMGKGWVRAEELIPGDRLTTFEGRELPVEAITHHSEALRVFNLTVGEAGTYYVSPARVLAHNCPWDRGDGTGRDPESGEGLAEGTADSGELTEGTVTEMGGELGEATGEVTADAAEAVGEVGAEAAADAAAEVAADVAVDAAATAGADALADALVFLLPLLFL